MATLSCASSDTLLTRWAALQFPSDGQGKQNASRRPAIRFGRFFPAMTNPDVGNVVVIFYGAHHNYVSTRVFVQR